jgi:hypothetical protein
MGLDGTNVDVLMDHSWMIEKGSSRVEVAWWSPDASERCFDRLGSQVTCSARFASCRRPQRGHRRAAAEVSVTDAG